MLAREGKYNPILSAKTQCLKSQIGRLSAAAKGDLSNAEARLRRGCAAIALACMIELHMSNFMTHHCRDLVVIVHDVQNASVEPDLVAWQREGVEVF